MIFIIYLFLLLYLLLCLFVIVSDTGVRITNALTVAVLKPRERNPTDSYLNVPQLTNDDGDKLWNETTVCGTKNACGGKVVVDCSTGTHYHGWT